MLAAIPAAEEMEIDVSDAEHQVLSMPPEIRAADARVKQANLEKKTVLAGYIPNISIGVVYIALPGFNNSIISKNILAPGLFINWNA